MMVYSFNSIAFIILYYLRNAVSTPIIGPVPTTLIGSSNTYVCSVDVTSGGLISIDKYCEIQKSMNVLDFEKAAANYLENTANNFHDQLYFKVGMEVRYIVKRFDAMHPSVSNFSVILEVSQDIDIVIITRMPFIVNKANDGVPIVSSTYTDWTPYSTTFQRPPSQQTSTIITVRLLDDIDVPNGFEGYLEIKNMTIEPFPQRGKYVFDQHKIQLHSGIAHSSHDYCSLLGNINALVLNNITIDSTQQEVYDDTTISNHATVYCAIYSIEKHHDRVKAVRDTWGKKCTAFLVFSDVTDDTLPSISIPHLGIESYGNMWQKVRSMLKYIHHHYIDEFDYFLIGGDDTYYVMENLYAYLNSDEIGALQKEGRGLYMGREFDHNDRELMYNTGGPGYILNKASLKILVEALGRCNTKMFVSCEDVFVAFCLKHLGGIEPYNTSDSLNRPRWHNVPPGYLVHPESDVTSLQVAAYLGRDVHLQYGENCCSEHSTAFHYLPPDLMRRIDDYQYRCPLEVKQKYYSDMGSHYYDSDTMMSMASVL